MREGGGLAVQVFGSGGGLGEGGSGRERGGPGSVAGGPGRGGPGRFVGAENATI